MSDEKTTAPLKVGDKVKFTVKASGLPLTDIITSISEGKCMGTAYNLSDYFNRGELKKV
jgi:hypothetical protein